jgi:hypothetical protein
MGRLLKMAVAALALGLYVWVASVKYADLVKKRKRTRRSV